MSKILFKTEIVNIINKPKAVSYEVGKSNDGSPLYHEEILYPVEVNEQSSALKIKGLSIPVPAYLLKNKNAEQARQFALNLDALLLSILYKLRELAGDNSLEVQATVTQYVSSAKVHKDKEKQVWAGVKSCKDSLGQTEIDMMFPSYQSFRSLKVSSKRGSWQEAHVYTGAIPSIDYALSRWVKSKDQAKVDALNLHS